MAYSGQCLTSEALGGRSANRGACAQACRLPYELYVDGERRDLGDRKYLISPQDLAAYDSVPELMPLVAALKIEGRLKTPEYVAATTRAYRKAVDEASAKFTRDEVLTLQQVFSRGFSHGFLDGDNHQTLVPGLSPKKRGIYLGRVTAVRGRRVQVALEAPLKAGDGVVFDYGRPEDDEPGGRVLFVNGDEFEVRNCPPPKIGWKVWKTDDPAINRALRATFEKTGARVPVDATVDETNGMLRVILDDGGHRVVGETGPLQVARNRPLTQDYLREHLGRLGETPFELRMLDVRLGNVMVPVRSINELRRRLAKELTESRAARPTRPVTSGALDRLRSSPTRTDDAPHLVVLCRSLEQARTAVEEGIRHLECDFEDIRKYREVPRDAWIALAPPQIFRPGESGILKNILGAEPDAILARSTAHLGLHPTVVGDFSLNIANELAADWFLSKGLTRYVPSYDLNWEQLQSLLKRTDPGRAEVVVHHHMPMFHMEHCVYAALLSKGKDCTDCGRPCDRHAISLEDRVGKRHPVKVDVGCRNTIYNAVPQSASLYVRGLLDLGVRWFRVELLLDTVEETRRLIRGYREVLEGRGDGQSLWRELRASSFLGVTRGPLGREE